MCAPWRASLGSRPLAARSCPDHGGGPGVGEALMNGVSRGPPVLGREGGVSELTVRLGHQLGSQGVLIQAEGTCAPSP